MKLVILSMLLTQPAWGHGGSDDCDYDLTLGSFTASVGSLAQALPHSMRIKRESSESGCKNYRLYFGKGQANSYQRRAYSGGRSLTYNLYRTISLGNILKDYGDAGSNEYLSGSISSVNASVDATWYVEVKAKDTLFSVPPGTYTDTVPIKLYSVGDGGLDYVTTKYTTLSFVVPRYAEVSIVDHNQPHDPSSTVYVMDFGNMKPKQELGADLLVKANVPYGISISSTNGGFLKKNSSTSRVPYQIKVGGSGWVTPSTTTSWLRNEARGSSVSGRRYNMKVRLGSFSNTEDGEYQEVITLTISAY